VSRHQSRCVRGRSHAWQSNRALAHTWHDRSVANTLESRPPVVGRKTIVRQARLPASKTLSALGKVLVMSEAALWAALLDPADSGSLPHAIRRCSECRVFVRLSHKAVEVDSRCVLDTRR
jgi:hypothetical protein